MDVCVYVRRTDGRILRRCVRGLLFLPCRLDCRWYGIGMAAGRPYQHLGRSNIIQPLFRTTRTHGFLLFWHAFRHGRCMAAFSSCRARRGFASTSLFLSSHEGELPCVFHRVYTASSRVTLFRILCPSYYAGQPPLPLLQRGCRDAARAAAKTSRGTTLRALFNIIWTCWWLSNAVPVHHSCLYTILVAAYSPHGATLCAYVWRGNLTRPPFCARARCHTTVCSLLATRQILI